MRYGAALPLCERRLWLWVFVCVDVCACVCEGEFVSHGLMVFVCMCDVVVREDVSVCVFVSIFTCVCEDSVCLCSVCVSKVSMWEVRMCVRIVCVVCFCEESVCVYDDSV